MTSAPWGGDGRDGRDNDGEGEAVRPVIRDKRRIDPQTGEVRMPEASGPASATSGLSGDGVATDPRVEEVEQALAERTADLQRLQAEYANYRKRVERDRLAVIETATGSALATLLPVVDDIDRARQHGDLTGGLKSVAESLEAALAKLGLQGFGEVGDPFDPSIHEAVMHAESDEVGEPTCTTVMRRGYRIGERLLRPAMVGVTDPVHPASASGAPAQTAQADQPADQLDSGDPTGGAGESADS